jgi:hypothetical protein
MSAISDAALELGAGLPVASESIGDSATGTGGPGLPSYVRAGLFLFIGLGNWLERSVNIHTQTRERRED